MQVELRVLNNEPRRLPPPQRFVWLALGFRPFFLMAAWAAVLLMALWIPQFSSQWQPLHSLDPFLWHGHEMLFGFSLAVVAGFLLTAVPNWTGHKTPSGGPLALLVGLWLAARVAVWYPWLSPGGTALLDLAFIPALVVSLAPALIKARQPRNLIFLPVLGFLALTNAMVWQGQGLKGLEWGLQGILMLVALIGGRVIPFFTSRALPHSRPTSYRALEIASLAGIPLALLAPSESQVTLSFLVGALHLLRLVGWYDPGLWRIPLLWILHLGYAWLGLGYLAQALALQGKLSPFLSLHCWTVGCLGQLILGMMARVALGHTGRELKAPPGVVAAFVLLSLATLTRTFLPALGGTYATWISASGGLWCLAFGLFAITYFPILTRPRVDGKPG